MRRRRLLVLVAVVGLLAVAAGRLRADDGPAAPEYKLTFDNAYGLSVGGDVRIGGVPSGRLTALDVGSTYPSKAIATVVLTRPGFDRLSRTASCGVRLQSLIGEYYIACEPGTGPPLAKGSTLPVTQTQSAIPLDLQQDVLRLPERQRARIIVNDLGAGLAGRPAELNAVIHRAVPALRTTNVVLGKLAAQKEVLAKFVRDSDTMLAELAKDPRAVARSFAETERTSRISAADDRALRAGLANLPEYLRKTISNAQDLRASAEPQIPLFAELQKIAGPLTTFFDATDRLQRASLPATRSLNSSSRIGSQALSDSARANRLLARVGRKAPDLATPLRQLLQSLDTRDRAYRPDPRAAATAPPAPDPTADATGKGFTGFENIARAFYGQTLALNGFDEVSHYFRTIGLYSTCTPYTTQPTKDQQQACGSYLGPNQPGVTTDDPTADAPSRARRAPALRRRPAVQPSDARPPASALPTRPAVGKPGGVPALPDVLPGISSTLDRLLGDVPVPAPRGGLPDLPKRPALPKPPASRDLLDFLLGR